MLVIWLFWFNKKVISSYVFLVVFLCCWCFIKVICVACRSPATCLILHAVAFKLSIFLASCLNLLCWKFLEIHIAIIYGLGYKFPHHAGKTKKDAMMQDLGCFWGYLAILTWACTALYHSSMLLFPCQKLVRRSKWAHTSLVCGLQNSLYFPQIVSRLRSSFDKPQDTYWSIPKSYSKQSLSCTSGAQVGPQVHTPECSHTSSTTFKCCGREHHWLSSPSWDLLCMAWTCLELLVGSGSWSISWSELTISSGLLGTFDSSGTTLCDS